jgi:hypothetical protein
MIGDISKGTSTVSLRHFSKSSTTNGSSTNPVFGWDYHRVQAHGGGTAMLPALVSDTQFTEVLSGLITGEEQVYAYEVAGHTSLVNDAQALLHEFSEITVTTVKLSVGVVHLGWLLVNLKTNRDIVHWKMRYHERDVKPVVPSSL